MRNHIGVDVSYPAVGYCDQPARPFTRFWINPWALELMIEGFTLRAPGCDYSIELGVVRVTHESNIHVARKDGTHAVDKVFVLTDEYDKDGSRLSVWPD